MYVAQRSLWRLRVYNLNKKKKKGSYNWRFAINILRYILYVVDLDFLRKTSAFLNKFGTRGWINFVARDDIAVISEMYVRTRDMYTDSRSGRIMSADKIIQYSFAAIHPLRRVILDHGRFRFFVI